MNPVIPIIQLKNVSKSFGYDGHRRSVLRSVSFDAYPGEMILLLGPSGSGKTTMLSLMAGLLAPDAGAVEIFGGTINSRSASELQRLRARNMGFVFQNFLLLDGLTVEENVLLVLEFAGWSRTRGKKRVQEMLERFECEDYAESLPAQLSQGERQRVAIARAVAAGARLILADEPTASLDSARGMEVIQLLHGLAKIDGSTVIVASHDLRLKLHADRIFTVEDGSVHEACAGGKAA